MSTSGRLSGNHLTHSNFKARRIPKVSQSGQTRWGCGNKIHQYLVARNNSDVCLPFIAHFTGPFCVIGALLPLISTKGCRPMEHPGFTWSIAYHCGCRRRASKGHWLFKLSASKWHIVDVLTSRGISSWHGHCPISREWEVRSTLLGIQRSIAGILLSSGVTAISEPMLLYFRNV